MLKYLWNESCAHLAGVDHVAIDRLHQRHIFICQRLQNTKITLNFWAFVLTWRDYTLNLNSKTVLPFPQPEIQSSVLFSEPPTLQSLQIDKSVLSLKGVKCTKMRVWDLVPRAFFLPPLQLGRSSPPSEHKEWQVKKSMFEVCQKLIKQRHLLIVCGWVIDPNFASKSCQEASVPLKYRLWWKQRYVMNSKI